MICIEFCIVYLILLVSCDRHVMCHVMCQVVCVGSVEELSQLSGVRVEDLHRER